MQDDQYCHSINATKRLSFCSFLYTSPPLDYDNDTQIYPIEIFLKINKIVKGKKNDWFCTLFTSNETQKSPLTGKAKYIIK